LFTREDRILLHFGARVQIVYSLRLHCLSDGLRAITRPVVWNTTQCDQPKLFNSYYIAVVPKVEP